MDAQQQYRSPAMTGMLVPLGVSSLALHPDRLQKRVAEFCLGILTHAQAQLAAELADAFAEIDRAIDAALVDPWLTPGAPPEKVEAIVAVATAVKEAVKAPLWQRFADLIEHDSRVADIRAEKARRRRKEAVHAVPQRTVVPIVVASEDKQPERWQQWAH
jgi:hypothetical protein